MRADADIRSAVEEEIDWDPEIGVRDIAVSVRNGVVMLAGFVHSFGEREQAEADARRVAGVIGLANDIVVRLPLVGRKPDPEIAREIVAGFQREIATIRDGLRVRVSDGHVALEGYVEWHYQRMRAAELAWRVRGIRSISNDIVVITDVVPMEIKRRIDAAFHRNAELNADEIVVEVTDDATVILAGHVQSPAEREDAERAAWSVPGVRKVANRIEVFD